MKFTILFIFFCMRLGLHAQFQLTTRINQAQELIMELRFDEARQKLLAEAEANPKNGFIPYLQSNILFMTVFVADDDRQYTRASDSLKILINRVKGNKADTSYFYKYCLAEMYFQLGAIHMQFGNNLKSAWVMMDAFKYIKENKGAPRRFLPQQMAEGMLNVTMGSIPSKYKFLAGLMGYKGDIEKGMTQLANATKTENTDFKSFKYKFAFVYGYAYSFLEADKTFNVWDVAPGYQNSPLLVYLQSRIYRERGENEPLIQLLESRPKKGRQPFYYLDFMLGKAKLNRLDADADAPFLLFLSKYPGQNYIKATHRYLAWHYHLRNSTKQRDYHIDMTKTRGKKMHGADQQAMIDIAKPLNNYLLKAQLYFDGGYLTKAKKELTAGAETYKTEAQRIEFHYRMGRIYQQMEEYLQATASYKNVFLYDDSENTFEAANAALQMGLIYEKLNKNQDAQLWYSRALGQEGFPFQDGIHQKAKAGLARVK